MKNFKKIWLLVLLLGSLKTWAAPPNWTVKPADFQFNMNLLVRLRANGNFDNAGQNMVGVFVGGELRGVAQPIFAGASAYFFITVYSNLYAGETLNFRIYHAADDRIYTANEGQIFKHNVLAGKFDQPFLVNVCRAFSTSHTTINPTCFGNSNGTIFTAVAGLAAPYTYLWSNGKTTRDINLLAAGTYTVTVTDAGGCTATQSTTLTQPANINFAVNFTPSTPGFRAVFTTSGGVPAYSYNRSPGMVSTDYRAATDPIFSNLAANTSFIFRVRDANGCQKSAIKKTPIAAPQMPGKGAGAGNRDGFDFENSADFGMVISPNPAADLVNLTLISDGETTGDLLLTDLFGRVIFDRKISFFEETSISLPVSNYRNGWYALVFREQSGRAVGEKLVLVR
jgi:hypothetical protein